MPRARRDSDDLYNARRRVRRMADRAEREGNYQRAGELRALASTNDMARLNAAYSAGKARETKQVASSSVTTSARAPRPKRISDELYNARRRLRRQAESILRQAKTETKAVREQMKSFARSLVEEANKLKGKRTSKEKQWSEIERLGNLRGRTKGASYGMTSTVRKNLIFMQQMNAAGTKGAESSISERAKSIFWVATKGLWPSGSNVPRNERYKRIQEHFYFGETSDAQQFREWAEGRGIDIDRRTGDLNLVLKYLLELNKNVPGDDGTDFDYEGYKKLILTTM